MQNLTGTNTTLGYGVLQFHHLPTESYWYWIGVGALLLYALLFNIIVTLALAYLKRKCLFINVSMCFETLKYTYADMHTVLFCTLAIKSAPIVLPSTIAGG